MEVGTVKTLPAVWVEGQVKWYNQKAVSECKWYNQKLWDFDIETDHVIEHRRSDRIVLYKTEINCHLLNISVREQNDWVERTGEGRQLQRARREVKKNWNLPQVVVVPVVIGALGVKSKRSKGWLKKLDVKGIIELLLKLALLGIAKVLRQVLEIWDYWWQLAL